MPVVTLEERELTLWHLLGPAMPEAMRAAGFSLPGAMTASTTDSGFIAQLGEDEFLLQAHRPPLTDQALGWVYARGDRVVALQGNGWRQVMAQVCPMDFSGTCEGDWVMAAAAGINVWCLGLPNGLLMGCDPSLGGYFYTMLSGIVQEVNETLANDDGVTI